MFACARQQESSREHTRDSSGTLTAAQCNYFQASGQVQICHATGSAKNPFALLKISDTACINAHVAHVHDYIDSNDPTCSGKGFLPPGAPCEGTATAPYGVPCSAGYSCQSGSCHPVDKCKGVVCTSAEACIYAYCDSNTGACVNEPTSGNSCDDGKACTLTDVCQSGACAGTDSACGLSISLSPAAPRTGQDITASINLPLSSAMTVAYAWTEQTSGLTASGAVLPGASTVRGQIWTVTATVSAHANSQIATASTTIVNTPPQISGATLAPSAPSREDTLACAAVGWTDPDGDPPLYNVAWFLTTSSGPVALSGSGLTRGASDLQVGAQVFCAVTPKDAYDLGATQNSPVVTVVDLPPALTGAAIVSSTTQPTVLSTLTCAAAGASDPDNDPLTTSYAWSAGGAGVAGAISSTLANAFVDGQAVTCTVTVSDGWLSASATSAPVVIQPSLPTIASVAVTGQLACGAWTCAASGLADADGHPVTPSYRWLIDGVQAATGASLPSGLVSGGQRVACAATPTVENGAVAGAEVTSQPVTAVDHPPVLTSVSIAASVHPGTALQCAASATDDCTANPAISYAWQVDGAAVAGAAAQSFQTGSLKPGDTVVCLATASDGKQTTSGASNTATVVNQSPRIAAVAITATDAVVTRTSTLTCIATGVSDPDGDALTTAYAWQVNGAPAASGATFSGGFSKGQSVTCTATASDPWTSTTVTSAGLAIQDAPPQVASATLSGQLACGAWTCAAAGVADPDGDAVSLTYAWTVGGALVPGATGSALPPGSVAGAQQVQCSITPGDGTLQGATVNSAASTSVDDPPVVTSVTIPPSPRRSDTLTCSVSANDDCTSSPAITYSWQVNGVASGAGAIFAASSTRPGDGIACIATVSDGYGSVTKSSNTATVVDQPPKIASVAITTTDVRPTALSTLTCAALGESDADGDPLTTSYSWFVNGAEVATGATLAHAFAKGQSVSCSALVSDGFASTALSSLPLLILDAPPVVGSAAVAGQDACGAWTCSASGVVDPDGDQVALHYRWLVGGAEVAGATQGTLPAGDVAPGDKVKCAVRGDDGTFENGVLLLGPETQSPEVTAVDEPPAIAAVTLPQSAHVWNTPLTCQVAASDDCTPNLSFTYSWQLNGQTVPGATSATFGPQQLGLSDVITCTATASDGAGSVAQVSNGFGLVDQAPSLAGAAVATLDGSAPSLLSTLSCNPIGASDPDGDALSFQSSWWVNGVASGGAQTLAGVFHRGDQVSCALVASDGYLTASAASQPIAIGDAPPVVGAVTIGGQSACGVWTCNASNVTDPDGDSTNLHYRWLVGGSAVPGATQSTYQSALLSNGQQIACAVSADDGVLTGPETQSQAASAAEAVPVINSVTLPAQIHDYASTVFTCAATLANDCDANPNVTYRWFLYGQSFGAPASSDPNLFDPVDIANWGPSTGDWLTCSATATNAAGTSATVVSNRAVFVDQSPVEGAVTLTTSDGLPPSTNNIWACNGTASDPDGDPLQTTWFWWINGYPILNITTQTITAAQAGSKIGDTVRCALDAIDPLYDETEHNSATYTVVGPLATVASATVSGSAACNTYSCDAAGVVPANGHLDYHWLVNGSAVAGQTSSTFPTTLAKGGDSIVCAVRGDNLSPDPAELAYGPEVQSALMVVPKGTPTMPASIPQYIHAGAVVTVTYQLPAGCTPFDITYAWYKNGAVDNSVSGSANTYDTSQLQVGDTIYSIIYAYAQNNAVIGTSNVGTIGDQPPTIGSVSITLNAPDTLPRAGSTFTCAASGVSDPDGDPFTVSYAWYVNSGHVSDGATSTPLTYHRGDQVQCQAVASDGRLSSNLTSEAATIHSTLPTVASVSVGSGGSGNNDVCQAFYCNPSGVNDVDGDPVALHYSWTLGGHPIAGALDQTLPVTDVGAGHGGAQLACTVVPDDNTIESGLQVLGNAVTSPPVTTVDKPPSIASVTLPATAHPGATVTCSVSATDDCMSQPILSFTWTRNGAAIPAATGSSLFTSSFAPGDTVGCVATASDAFQTTSASSNTLSIVNHPPTIASASLSVNGPTATKASILTCSAGKEADADADPLTTAFSWQVNGATVAGATSNTFSGGFSHGQTVGCTATVRDAWSSAAAASNAVVIQDIAPVVGRAFVAGTDACGVSTCTASPITDADGDPVTLTYQWFDNGVAIPNSNSASFATNSHGGDAVACAVTPNDGMIDGGQVLSSGVRMSVSPPQATATVSPAFISGAGPTLTCAAGVVDDCSAAQPDSTAYAWFVNGAQQSGAAATFSTSALKAGDAIYCKATVSGEGGSSTATTNTVSVPATVWTLTANIANGQAGASVAVIDDLNADGYREIAIGAPNTTDPRYTFNSRAGAIYLVNGRNNVAASKLSDVVAGTGGRYLLGERGGFQNATMVCNDKTNYVGGCPLIHDVGADLGAEIAGPDGAGLGFQMAYAGDVDGDGVGDLIVGSPYDQVVDLWKGRTWMLSGSRLLGRPFEDAQLGNGGYTFDGECGRRRGLDLNTSRTTASNGDLTGWRVVPLGDVNGDGLADFAVSAPNNGDFDEGTVYVVFGRKDKHGVSASDLLTRGCNLDGLQQAAANGSSGFAAYAPNRTQSSSAPPQWGRLLAPAGDFNGDGYDDFIVSSHGAEDSNAQGNLGNTAWVMLGGPNPQPQAIQTLNPATQWEIDLGDFSCTSNAIGNLVCTGLNGTSWPMGGGGDVNGDGYDDLAFNAFGLGSDSSSKTYGGWLNVLYGGPSSSGHLSLNNSIDGSSRGFMVTGGYNAMNWDSESGVVRIVQDLNGDGYDDIVLGVPTHNGGQGGVFVVFGSATPPANLTLANLRAGVGGFTIEPTVAGARFGASIAAGDIDGDGLTDLVIGAPGSAGSGGESGAGSVQVVFGRDFSKNAITFLGTPGNDTFTGTAAAENIVGGRGNDVLIGGGGADVIYGGAGDDLIEVDDDSFRRVNGGPGNDTLVLGPEVSGLTLTGHNRRRIQEIENIQLQGQTVTVSKLGLVAISNTTHKLALSGQGAVSLLANDHWASAGAATGADGTSYLTLTDGNAQLWIAKTLSTSIPPTIFNNPITVAENSPAGTITAKLLGTDPDGNDASLRWKLLADPSGAFALDAATGNLTVASAVPLDFEAKQWPWNLTVSLTDQTGLVTQTTIVVSLSDVPEPPVFVTVAPRWTVGEAAQGVLGNVQATDPDIGDSVTYGILNDASGLFQIDPVKGEVSLLPGKVFNAALTPSYTLAVTATDTTGLSAELTVQLDVIPQDPLTKSAHVTFNLDGWSIYQDQAAAAFPGFTFQGFSNDSAQPITRCFTSASGAQNFKEVWNALSLGPVIPFEIDATMLGQVCISVNVAYNKGTVNASLPYDVTFSYPDNIVAGSTFELDSTAKPSSSGAAVWGQSTSVVVGGGMQYIDWGAYYALCSKMFGSPCKVLFDKQGINAKFYQEWGMPVQQWTAPGSAGSTRFATAQPVVGNLNGLNMNWDDWIWTIFSMLNLPSNTGDYTAYVGDWPVELKYNIFSTQAGVTASSSWDLELDVGNISAEILLENGSRQAFTLGTPVQIQVPADADVNRDGRVDVSIVLHLNSNFKNHWDHTENTGYSFSGFGAKLLLEDQYGNIQNERVMGPLITAGCTPSSNQAIVNGHACYSTHGVQDIAFSPSGFSQPIILGGLPLAK